MRGATTSISKRIAFDNNKLFALNFAVSVIKKQPKNISKGIPKATIQFGFFVVIIVIVIMFYTGS